MPTGKGCNTPHLGLATTRELLTELKARMEVSIITDDSVNQWVVYLANAATTCLETLGDTKLAHRTVDSE